MALVPLGVGGLATAIKYLQDAQSMVDQIKYTYNQVSPFVNDAMNIVNSDKSGHSRIKGKNISSFIKIINRKA